MSIELRNISKTFGAYRALQDVNLLVPSGELVALLGPSGSGKTTLLRIIAGLENPDPGGTVLFHDQEVANRPVGERRVGFVFQHYALFRHMSVFENVAFGLRVKPRKERPSKAEIRDRVMELLRLVQLEGMEKRRPSQLSGGQRQRVALARALAIQPSVLLLDEPFGALDAKVRAELRRWLRKLHDEIHVTSVFVTHDQEEALEVADTIVVMNRAKIEQIGTPEDVFHRPATEFVMDFLGQVNLFHARGEGGIEGAGAGHGEGADASHRAVREGARIYVRPFDVELSPAHESPGPGAARAVIERVHSAGPQVRVEMVGPAGESLQALVPHEKFRARPFQRGEEVWIAPRETRTFVDPGAGI